MSNAQHVSILRAEKNALSARLAESEENLIFWKRECIGLNAAIKDIRALADWRWQQEKLKTKRDEAQLVSLLDDIVRIADIACPASREVSDVNH